MEICVVYGYILTPLSQSSPASLPSSSQGLLWEAGIRICQPRWRPQQFASADPASTYISLGIAPGPGKTPRAFFMQHQRWCYLFLCSAIWLTADRMPAAMNWRGCSALSPACWVLCNASVMFQICLIFMKIQTNFSPAIDRVACSRVVFLIYPCTFLLRG